MCSLGLLPMKLAAELDDDSAGKATRATARIAARFGVFVGFSKHIHPVRYRNNVIVFCGAVGIPPIDSLSIFGDVVPVSDRRSAAHLSLPHHPHIGI